MAHHIPRYADQHYHLTGVSESLSCAESDILGLAKEVTAQRFLDTHEKARWLKQTEATIFCSALPSCKGHEKNESLLVDQGADVNAQSGEYSNALQEASFGGHEVIVKLLLTNGAEVVNAQGGWYGDALQAAACEGHEGMVKLLLDKGANVNAQGGEHGSALYAASCGGHEKIVKLLPAKAAEFEAAGAVSRLH